MRILILRSRPKGGVSKDGTAHGWFFSNLLGKLSPHGHSAADVDTP